MTAPVFDDRGRTVSGEVSVPCGKAIEVFRAVAHKRVQLARLEAGLTRALMELPGAELAVYYIATELIEATAAAEVDEIEARAAARRQAVEYQTGRRTT